MNEFDENQKKGEKTNYKVLAAVCVKEIRVKSKWTEWEGEI